MKTKILVVDDNQSIREFVQLVLGLSDDDYHVLLAEDGVTAKATLELHDDIALVVTDTQMPRMDGLELVRWIKANRSIPVIIATGSVDDGIIAQVAASGADKVLRKPYRNVELLDAVAKLIEPLYACGGA